jgi:hypothetical protein
MEAQEIFETVWNHFVVGGAALSKDPFDNACYYRAPDGRKCAVGVLVTDEECRYFGFSSVRTLDIDKKLPARLRPHVDMLVRLQTMHDSAISDAGLCGDLRRFAANNDFGVHAPEAQQ